MRKITERVEAQLEILGADTSLEELVRAAKLRWPKDNAAVCSIRKRWMARKAVEVRYVTPGQAVQKKTARLALYHILDVKGQQTTIPTLIDAAKAAGFNVSYGYAVSVRKKYCTETNLPLKDARTLQDIPERDMDRQAQAEDVNYLSDLQRKYRLPFDKMKELAERFKSVKLLATLEHVELCCQLKAA